jgi:hypothetical protein
VVWSIEQHATARVTDWHPAYFPALQACALAAARLDAHWELKGDVQQGLTDAVTVARAAATSSQATRTRAQLLASRLDAAAMIIESGSKSAQMKVVAHQLDNISLDA